MDAEKKKRLAAVGWVETSLEELLGLTSEEIQLIDLRRSMAHAAKEARIHAGLTQADIAKKLNTRQPSVARAEQPGKDVSLDFIARCLVAAGGTVEPRFGFAVKKLNTVKAKPKRKLPQSAKA